MRIEEYNANRLSPSSIASMIFMHGIIGAIVLALVFGVIALMGFDILKFNGTYIKGFRGLLISPFIGIIIGALFGAFEFIFIFIGSLISSRFIRINIKIINRE